jgi:hypothetical protein
MVDCLIERTHLALLRPGIVHLVKCNGITSVSQLDGPISGARAMFWCNCNVNTFNSSGACIHSLNNSDQFYTVHICSDASSSLLAVSKNIHAYSHNKYIWLVEYLQQTTIHNTLI